MKKILAEYLLSVLALLGVMVLLPLYFLEEYVSIQVGLLTPFFSYEQLVMMISGLLLLLFTMLVVIIFDWQTIFRFSQSEKNVTKILAVYAPLPYQILTTVAQQQRQGKLVTPAGLAEVLAMDPLVLLVQVERLREDDYLLVPHDPEGVAQIRAVDRVVIGAQAQAWYAKSPHL